MEIYLGLASQATLCSIGTGLPRRKGISPRIFGPCLLWPKGWMDEDASWYGSRPQPRPHCIRRGPSSAGNRHSSPHLFDPASPPLKGHNPQFLSNIHCGQTTGWMKTPLGTEVDRGPGHIVLDGVRGLRERGTAAPSFRGPCLLWPNGWMDQNESWHAGRPRPCPHCVRWGPTSPSRKGAQSSPSFGPISVVAKWLDGLRCHLVWR